MAAGLPYICSDFPAWRKLTESIDAGIVINPKNPEELTRAVNYLLNHLEKAEEMGRKGRQAVMERFTWKAESLKLQKLYEIFTEV